MRVCTRCKSVACDQGTGIATCSKWCYVRRTRLPMLVAMICVVICKVRRLPRLYAYCLLSPTSVQTSPHSNVMCNDSPRSLHDLRFRSCSWRFQQVCLLLAHLASIALIIEFEGSDRLTRNGKYCRTCLPVPFSHRGLWT